MPSPCEFIFLSGLSFLFGVTQKIADGHADHGLNFFPGAGIIFGLVCGGTAFYLIGYSPVLQAVYLGPLLYWFYKKKIDCLPHIMAAIMMLFGVFLSKGAWTFPLYPVLGVFAGYVVLDFIKHHHNLPVLKTFFDHRLHFHLIHLVFALAVRDVYGYSSLFFGLLGTAVATRVFSIPSDGGQKTFGE